MKIKKFSEKINENIESSMETAKEFCDRIDKEEGEAWSNDYKTLSKKMQEYAEYYHEYMIANEN